MAQSILIVHPSELMRRGLLSCLEDLPQVSVFCFSELSEIHLHEHAGAGKLLIFVPTGESRNPRLLEMRTRIGEHRLFGLAISAADSFDPKFFDRVFLLDVSVGEIRKITREFFASEQVPQTDELTPREREVLRLIALGNTSKAIAEALIISQHTVISHRKNITEKLGIKSIPGLTVYAIIQKIVDPSDISPEQL